MNEYFQRTLEARKRILAKPELVRDINQTVHTVLEGGELPERVIQLGAGYEHRVFSVGAIRHPERDSNLEIALKINCNKPNNAEVNLRSELGAYQLAFEEAGAIEVPYFGIIVTSQFENKRLAAMLTEDVSERGKIEMKEELDYPYAELSNGRTVYIDLGFDGKRFGPIFEEGEKYLEENARIDL